MGNITVGSNMDFTNINEAISYADDGDTILMFNDISSNIVINKAVNLRGMNNENGDMPKITSDINTVYYDYVQDNNLSIFIENLEIISNGSWSIALKLRLPNMNVDINNCILRGGNNTVYVIGLVSGVSINTVNVLYSHLIKGYAHVLDADYSNEFNIVKCTTDVEFYAYASGIKPDIVDSVILGVSSDTYGIGIIPLTEYKNYVVEGKVFNEYGGSEIRKIFIIERESGILIDTIYSDIEGNYRYTTWEDDELVGLCISPNSNNDMATRLIFK